MKGLIRSVATIVLLASSIGVNSAQAADTPPANTSFSDRWSITTASEVRYFSWRSTRGFPSIQSSQTGSGSELYIPFAAQLVGLPSDELKVEILGRGGWVHARQSSPGLSGEVSTTIDTQVSATATYLGINGVQPFVSINLNLPTGRSALFGTAANARMDPDLVEIATFGEGLNVGPTAGFNFSIDQSWSISVSAGYTRRGSFTRESGLAVADVLLQTPTKIEPGSVFTGTTTVAYQAGAFSARGTGTISWETDTKVDEVPFVRPGRRYLLSGTSSYDFKQVGVTTLTASWAHGNRNDIRFCSTTPGGSLVPICVSSLAIEPFNSNSDLYRAGLQHLVPVGQFGIGPTVSWLMRTHNSYDPQTLQFVPAKTRWSAGAIAQYAANEKLNFNARLEHVWTHENERPDENFSVIGQGPLATLIAAIPAVSSRGWQASFGFNLSF
jgi:hypothetical protein